VKALVRFIAAGDIKSPYNRSLLVECYQVFRDA